MNRRSGLTLVEVLIAILIMGVGMLSILTLFPIGLLNCRQALQDDRVVQAATNASAIALARNIRHDPLVETQFATGTMAVYVDGFYANNGAGSAGRDYSPLFDHNDKLFELQTLVRLARRLCFP